MTKKFKMYIDGEWVDSSSGETFEVVSPIDGEVIAEVPLATKEDVDRAVKAAKRNRESYKLTSDLHRSDLLHKIADEVEKRKEELANWMTLENGKPYETESLPEVEETVSNLHQAAEDIKRLSGEVVFAHDGNKKILTFHEPHGVYACITPWNFPSVIPAEYIAPGLVAGNTMVMKPASSTPLSVILLAECIEAAGVPAGVFNVVTGPGSVVGQELVSHPDVDAIGFTGETVTGKAIAKSAGLKPQLLEMGGNGPQIVCDDADLTEAAKEAAWGAYYNAGQVCCATERVLVQKSVKKEFMEELLKAAKEFKLGSPFDKGVNVGPITNEDTAEKTDRHLKDAVEKGANIVYGGKRAEGFATNRYYEPTIIDNVKPGMELHDEETFGPVIPVIEFETDEEGLEIANSTRYGLQMAVFTSSLKRANWYAKRLKTGNLNVNASTCYWEEHQPFGGCASTDTGKGRLGGMYTIKDMTQLKTVLIDFDKC